MTTGAARYELGRACTLDCIEDRGSRIDREMCRWAGEVSDPVPQMAAASECLSPSVPVLGNCRRGGQRAEGQRRRRRSRGGPGCGPQTLQRLWCRGLGDVRWPVDGGRAVVCVAARARRGTGQLVHSFWKPVSLGRWRRF